MDDWWRIAGKTELLLKAARKGDARSLKLVNRYIKELEREHGIMQIIEAWKAAMMLKEFLERPRYTPTFRHSYNYDVFCEALSVGRRAAVA